jgi:hypothetical protein
MDWIDWIGDDSKGMPAKAGDSGVVTTTTIHWPG